MFYRYEKKIDMVTPLKKKMVDENLKLFSY